METTVTQKVEFGSMNPGDRFIIYRRSILFGDTPSIGTKYEKIASQQYGRGHFVREVNARTLDRTEYCWIAPCHEVDLI